MKAIISYLQRRPYSCSELAEKTGLSKPALTKITFEMQELELLQVVESVAPKKEYLLGRKPVYYTMSPNFGYVAAVDFSTVRIAIRFSDMSGRVIVERSIEDAEYLSFDILDKVVEQLKLLNDEYSMPNRPLLTICLAGSGMIDSDGNIVQAPKFTECTGTNLRNYFQKSFEAQVIVKNDIKLLLFGEYKHTKAKNIVMLYIDSGIGGAIGINGTVLEGEEGFAGEFGLLMFSNEGVYQAFDDLSSVNAIKKQIRKRRAEGEQTILPEKFRFNDVVVAFKQGDELVVSVVRQSAVFVATFITNMYRILNSKTFLIGGRISRLGENYLQIIKSYLSPQITVSVSYNTHAEEAVINGAVQVAIEHGIDVVIDNR